MAANRTTNSKKKVFSYFKIRGPQPICRESSEARVVGFRPSFLLQDEAVEPYLQRHPYTFEVQERVRIG